MPGKSPANKRRKSRRKKWTDIVGVAAIVGLLWILYSSNRPPGKIAIPTNIAPVIQEASDKYDVPKSLVEGVIAQESSMNPNAVSRAGAQGLMQLMPATAHSLGVTNPFDPNQNIMAGTRYLSELLHRYHGNEKLALAAYNAGPSAVDEYKGIPPYPETTHYVQSVLDRAAEYSKP